MSHDKQTYIVEEEWGSVSCLLACLNLIYVQVSKAQRLMTCGDIFRVIIAFFIPPLGVFTQVGFTQPFWINLVIYLFAVGGLGFPVLFGMWPAAVIHALFVILTRK